MDEEEKTIDEIIREKALQNMVNFNKIKEDANSTLDRYPAAKTEQEINQPALGDMFNLDAKSELDSAMDVTTGKNPSSDVAVLGGNTDMITGDVQSYGDAQNALSKAENAKPIKETKGTDKGMAIARQIGEAAKDLASNNPYSAVDSSVFQAGRMPASKDIMSARLNALRRLSSANKLG